MSPPDFTRLADPIAHAGAMPSFLWGQLLFFLLAALALAHAWRRGRGHLLIWVAALVAGTANDFIFMALPLVDNFWQAQGLVMLTPRMPAYIPCVYISFMYFPTVAVREAGLGRWGVVALTGLLACLFYAPYDIVGARFLWWTWHDTDGPIAARILGAPTSSSLWVLTFVGAFAGLIDHSLRGVERVTDRVFGLGLLKVAGLTTLLMMVQMTALQQLDGGSPAFGALAGGVALYGVVAVIGGRGGKRGDQRLVLGAVVVYFASLVLIGATFAPEAHRSTGLHQEVGECYVEQVDITGQSRFQFLCLEDYEETWDFACTEAPAAGSTWYTICGLPHDSFPGWMAGLTGLCLGGFLAFWALVGRRRGASPLELPSG